MVSGRYAHRKARDPHIPLHNSSPYRNSFPRISSKSTSYRKSNFDAGPYVNKEDMDQHGIIARMDEDISWVEFCGCHTFDRTNEAVTPELVEGRLPSCTNRCK